MPEYAEQSTPWYSSASDITSVVLTEGITRISANAFEGCSNLISIELPQSVTSIGTNAFADCSLLETVDYLGTINQWSTLQMSIANGNNSLLGATLNSSYSGTCGDNATWIYDENTKTLTIGGSGPMWDWNSGTFTDTPWYKFKSEIKTIAFDEGITTTGRYAFLYMEALTEIRLSSTIEIIGGFSFGWNSTLETLIVPEGVRFISGRAFSRVDNLKTIYFPSTLESIDMYAFIFGSGYGPISDVYYNGTKEDWAKVYLSSQGDNAHNLLPDSDTTWHYLKEYAYYSDVAETAWYGKAVYNLKDTQMIPTANTFGVNKVADTEWVLGVLFTRAGSPGFYADSLDWAKVNGIVSENTEKADSVSMNILAEILHHTALFNGYTINLKSSTALAWCTTQGYISDYADNVSVQSTEAPLTRAEAASVLVAYLNSPFGSANRYDRLRDQMKVAYKAGGDGKMYILALHHSGIGKVGDSTLILMPGGQLMLIDTFRSDGWTDYLKETLDYLEVTSLDYLVLSHGHSDHDYNLSNVANYLYDAGYTIGTYWSAGNITSSREMDAISLMESKGVTIEKKIRMGTQRTIGVGTNAVVVDFLWPTSAGAPGDNNNKSLTMKITYGDSSYLTGGDLFMDGELAIIELYKDNLQLIEADVMKTNHHGSYSSNCREWIDVVNPSILLTHGDDNGDSALCYQYSLEGREWYSTGRDGGVLVIMDNNKNITVTTGYDTNLRKYVTP